MTEHQYSKCISKMSTPLEVNYIRQPQYEKTFFNILSGERFEKNDVEIMTYKRNKIIKEFFSFYLSNSKYSLIEIGFDFSIAPRTGDIILKLKRQVQKINLQILGSCWLVDKGEMGNMHFHLVIAIPRINIAGKSLPPELKITYKTKKVHSSFVSNKLKLRDYLLKKEIYYIGKRKRVYGKSRFYYTKSPIKTILKPLSKNL